MSTFDVANVDGNQYFGAGAAKTTKNAYLDMQTFLQLLTTQLSNQNPLEPMNDRDFFAQMAQLGTVQGIDELKKSAQVDQANMLIGKHVTAVRSNTTATDANQTVDGVVVGLSIKNGERVLQVQESNGGIADVKMDSLLTVADVVESPNLSNALGYANSAQFIGRTIQAPHPTLKDSNGKAETLKGVVKSVNFENGSIYLTVNDRLGNPTKVNLLTVDQIGE